MMKSLKSTWLVSSKLTWRIWRILTRAFKNLKNLHFNRLLLTKVYNVWAKKLQRSYFWWHWRLTQNLKGNWLVLPTMTFTSALKSLKTGTLMGSFYPKYKLYELKLYRKGICHDNEEWRKIWRGIDLSVQNWNRELDECWPEHSKISEYVMYIMFELKKIQRSYVWWH